VNGLRTIKSYIYSIFYNLTSNSIKFKQPGIPPIIEISSFLSENKIVLLFKDNGLGIDLNKKGNQVFGLYKRFHLDTEGKGIGLYMVKTQVESLGGTIFIHSNVNTGTEFRIEFENENES
jgi:signal transduction histidine kinase